MDAPQASDEGDAVIVFDGVCNLCSRWVRFLLPRDRAGRFRFAAMQTEAGQRLLSRHGLDPHDPVSFLFLDGGRAYTDSTAILRVLVRLGWPWRAAAVGYLGRAPSATPSTDGWRATAIAGSGARRPVSCRHPRRGAVSSAEPPGAPAFVEFQLW